MNDIHYLPTMARPCAAITRRELSDEVIHTPISAHMAAGTSRSSTAPAANLRLIEVVIYGVSAFLLGFGVVGGFHG